VTHIRSAMSVEVVGTGMIARAFESHTAELPPAIICASGVADSRCTDPSAFQRERELVRELARRAVAQDARLVYFSGAPVYGPSTGKHAESDRPAPVSPYGRHKLECEAMIASCGARYLVLRLPNVVGAVGNPNQLLPSLVAQVAAGQVVVRAGATRDLLDVDDVVRVVRALIRRGATDTIVNVASGVSTPVQELAEQIGAILGVSPTFAIVDGGDRQEFSTVLVRSLLSDYPQFDADYPARILTRYVPSIYRALKQGELAGRPYVVHPS
jgi:nucleoside-diphosphate-sugar epimerase